MAWMRPPYYAGSFVVILCFLYLGFIISGRLDVVNVTEPSRETPARFNIGEAKKYYIPEVSLGGPGCLVTNGVGPLKQIDHFPDTPSGPCTLIRILSPDVTSQDLHQIQETLSRDDVWTGGFLQHVIFNLQGSPRPIQLSTDARRITKGWHGSVSFMSGLDTELEDIPTGPYYYNAGQLHKVYRLYPDTVEAFTSSTIQSLNDPYLYTSLDVSAFTEEYPSVLTIAVPSRLYFMPTDEKTLAGLRIAVKDTQDVRGIKTTGSSRAWTRLYGPREKSATGVQRLLDSGVVSEFPTGDWVDYHAPWNPRADGYQSPSASSSGSGAALAAYDWLDISTGTDCSGSIRAPAAAHGLFGIRPSTDAIENEGVIPFSKNFDTFGVFTRDMKTLTLASSVLYSQTAEVSSCFEKPTRLVYLSEYWPVEDTESSVIFERSIEKLERALGIKRTELSLGKLWSETNPVGTSLSIDDYFKKTFVTASAPDQWDMLKKFHLEFQNAFGHAPPLNPQLQWKMKFLPNQTIEMQREGEKQVMVFRNWFHKHVMQKDDEGCAESILVLPWTNGQPSYRDEYRPPPNWTGEGWFFYFISVYGGAPEIILPLGQTRYHSRMTQREEWLPVAIGIVGARGTDTAFVSFMNETLTIANLPRKVDVGRSAFTMESTAPSVLPMENIRNAQELR
ncbi:amidase [Penicillium angulare]|uniref:Amidase n=1 Tax=Penicillium angulare TaxID=116970 RepID=A0A9W9G7S2_9EURO|nr:amidase [Penicillium angulare]